MANLGYILKESVMNAAESLDAKDFKTLISGLFSYAVYGEIPNFEQPTLRAVFELEKPAIDWNNSKWAKRTKEYERMHGGQEYVREF